MQRWLACTCCQHMVGRSLHDAVDMRSSYSVRLRHRHRWRLDAPLLLHLLISRYQLCLPYPAASTIFTIADAIQVDSSHDVRSQKLEFQQKICRTSYITVHYKPREFRNELRKCDLQQHLMWHVDFVVALSSYHGKYVVAGSHPYSPFFSLSSGLGNTIPTRYFYGSHYFSLFPVRPARRRAPAAPPCLNGHELDFPNYSLPSPLLSPERRLFFTLLRDSPAHLA